MESAFARSLVRYLKTNGFFVQRIESALTGRGIPDFFAITPYKVAFWMELKDIKGTQRIPWRPHQQEWLHGCSLAGCYAFTCIREWASDGRYRYHLAEHDRLFADNHLANVPHKTFLKIGELSSYLALLRHPSETSRNV